jgi:hypothetical protein
MSYSATLYLLGVTEKSHSLHPDQESNGASQIKSDVLPLLYIFIFMFLDTKWENKILNCSKHSQNLICSLISS